MMEHEVFEALKIVGENSLKSDRALLKMGEAIIDKLTHTDEVVRGLIHRVSDLQDKVKELSERTDILLTMFNTQSH